MPGLKVELELRYALAQGNIHLADVDMASITVLTHHYSDY